MAKGSRTGRYGGGGGLSSGDILETRDLVSDRERNAVMVDEVLSASKAMNDEYGAAGTIAEFDIAKLKQGKAQNAIAYYDGANIGVNERFMNKNTIETAYAQCVKEGFHPSNGNKTAMEAVTAHEFGHALTDKVGEKIGISNIDASATRIVTEARKYTSSRGVVQMASKISKYATHSNAEAVAEAIADVFCNGNKAAKESLAIKRVIDGYLKP